MQANIANNPSRPEYRTVTAEATRAGQDPQLGGALYDQAEESKNETENITVLPSC